MKLMIDPELPDHRKVYNLAAALKVEHPVAFYTLVRLWCKVIVQNEDGVLHGWKSTDISRACGWLGDPTVLCNALVQTRWIKRIRNGFKIHQWVEHQGDIIVRRKQDRDRKRRERSKGSHGGVTPDSDVTPPDSTPPSHSLPSPSLPSHAMPSEDRSPAIKKARAKAESHPSNRCRAALLRYLGFIENEPGVPGHRIEDLVNRAWSLRESMIGDNGIPADEIFDYAIEQTIKYKAFTPGYIGQVIQDSTMRWRDGSKFAGGKRTDSKSSVRKGNG